MGDSKERAWAKEEAGPDTRGTVFRPLPWLTSASSFLGMLFLCFLHFFKCVHVYECAHVPVGVSRGWKSVSDPLEL